MSITNANDSNVAQIVVQVLTSWLEGGENEQGKISADALKQAVASQGGDPNAVDSLNMGPLYATACQNAGLPEPPPYHGPVTVDRIIHEVQDVTYNIDNSDNSQNVNNSLNIGEGANIDGPLNYDPVSGTGGSVVGGGDVVGATGGSVAGTGGSVGSVGGTAVGGDLNQAGAGSTIFEGTNYGNQNSGDHSAQVGGTGFGTGSGGPEPSRILTAEHPGGLGGMPININTGDGATQQVADTQGANSPIHFGAGDDTNVSNSTLDHSAIGHDHVFGGNTASDGSSIGDGNETEHIQDSHDQTQTSTITQTDSDGSSILADQGPGEHHDTADSGTHFDAVPDHIIAI